jgi:general secretion pathway protein K
MTAARIARSRIKSRQQGVAVITALLLTTLAITIVASLFWQQQVQVRTIENQRLQLQKQWILRGALDWARLILREDAKYSSVDHLGEPWAVNLAETRLDQYVENGRADIDTSDAALSGSIIDAQSRYNLANLSVNGEPAVREVDAFTRLLNTLHISPALAKPIASAMAAAQQPLAIVPGALPDSAVPGAALPNAGMQNPVAQNTAAQSASTPKSTVQSDGKAMMIVQLDDLLAVPGMTPDILAKMKDYVIVLPRATPVNVNTAPAEVMAARIDTLSVSEATALVSSRDRAYFRDTSDFIQRLQGKQSGLSGNDVSVTTNYFLVNGKVRLNRASLDVQALIERAGTGTKIIWIREN